MPVILPNLARLRRDQAHTLGVSPAPGISGVLRKTPRVSSDDDPLRLAQETTAALEHARQAHQITACDGLPNCTYKVAYDEAGALVEKLEHEGVK